MHIKITGKNLDIGDSLRGHIEERIQAFRHKYFDGTIHAQIVVEKSRSSFDTDCTLHLATGLTLQSHGSGAEALVSFEAAASRLERQLKRYKKRLKDHHKSRREPLLHIQAQDYTIAADEAGDEALTDLNPVIVAEMPTKLPELTVGEAVMQLDVSSLPFVFFRNSKGGHFNLVYRRHDGNIGWIDPAISS